MNYVNRTVIFALEHKQLIMLLLCIASFGCSVVYSWGPPGEPD